MSKKLDWDELYKPFGTQTVDGVQPKYRSGRELLQKRMEEQKNTERLQKNFYKIVPALEALLKCRMESGNPLEVRRSISYTNSELVHTYAQVEDRENGGWKNGDVQYSQFQDVEKSLAPGTKLILKSLDPTMNEFIFEDQLGNEIILPYLSKQQLMTQTDIYESVLDFMNKQGDPHGID